MNKSEFMRICLYCKQNHVELEKPKFYCPTGEKIDDTARKLFAEILGPGIIDSMELPRQVRQWYVFLTAKNIRYIMTLLL